MEEEGFKLAVVMVSLNDDISRDRNIIFWTRIADELAASVATLGKVSLPFDELFPNLHVALLRSWSRYTTKDLDQMSCSTLSGNDLEDFGNFQAFLKILASGFSLVSNCKYF